MRREFRERFPRHRLQRKPPVSDPSMHHGTYVTHVPWCMWGSLIRGNGVNVPGIPGACANRKCSYLVRGPYPLELRIETCYDCPNTSEVILKMQMNWLRWSCNTSWYTQQNTVKIYRWVGAWRRNSSALSMELRRSCTNPTICVCHGTSWKYQIAAIRKLTDTRTLCLIVVRCMRNSPFITSQQWHHMSSITSQITGHSTLCLTVCLVQHMRPMKYDLLLIKWALLHLFRFCLSYIVYTTCYD